MSRQQIRVALGNTLRTLRKTAGIAQEDVAWAAKVERAHMSLLERGEGNATIETLVRILAVLNVSFKRFGAELDKELRASKRAPPPNEGRS